MTVYSLYLPDDRLSLAELAAARLDGELFELGEAFVATDAVEYAGLRAATYAPLAGSHWAATQLCAAWVHGATHSAPRHVTLQRVSPRRRGYVPSTHVSYRDSRLPECHTVRMHGVAVTSPARTIADLARSTDTAHLAAGAALARMMRPAAEDALRDADAAPRVPHRLRALAVIRRWLAG